MTENIYTSGQREPVAEVEAVDRYAFLRPEDWAADAAVDLGGDTALDEFLNDAVRGDQERSAREMGQVSCPGQWDAHLELTEQPCPYCHASL